MQLLVPNKACNMLLGFYKLYVALEENSWTWVARSPACVEQIMVMLLVVPMVEVPPVFTHVHIRRHMSTESRQPIVRDGGLIPMHIHFHLFRLPLDSFFLMSHGPYRRGHRLHLPAVA